MIIGTIVDGIVIDHIPAGRAMDLYRDLGLDKLECEVAVIKNASSGKYGKKDILKINEVIEDAAASQALTEEQLALIRTYMSFGEDGLTIGKSGNPLTFRVVNDRLAFYMNNTEVAYLSDNKLYVTQAEILAKLQIGKFAFEPQSNGNLSLIYTG